MKRNTTRFTTCLCGVIAGTLGMALQAQVATYEFTGTVQTSQMPEGFLDGFDSPSSPYAGLNAQVGDPVTGRFSFSRLPGDDFDPSPDSAVYADGKASVEINVNGHRISTWMAMQATTAKQEQIRLRVEADRERVEAQKQRIEAETARQLASAQAARLTVRIYRDHLDRAQAAIARADFRVARQKLDACDPVVRGWEWNQVNGMNPLRLLIPAAVTPIVTEDGQIIMIGTGNESRSVNVWDSVTGRVIRTWLENDSGLGVLAISADEQRLAASDASGDGPIKLWDTSTGERGPSFSGVSGEIRALAFNRDGTLVGVGSNAGLRVFETATGEEILAIEFSSQRDCWQLAFGIGDGWIAAFTQLGSTLDTGVWSLPDAKPLSVHAHDSPVRTLAFGPDGFSLASGSSGSTVKVWNAVTRELVRVVPVDAGRFLAFSPDGGSVLSGGQDGAVRLWDPENGRLVRSFSEADVSLQGGAFSPDGRYVGTSSLGPLVRIWDVDTGALLHELRPQFISATTMNLWQARKRKPSGPPLGSITNNAHPTDIVAFRPDSAVLASRDSDGTVRLWDTKSGRALRELNADAPLTSVVFSPDGMTVAAGSWDRSIYRWNPDTGEPLKPLQGAHPNPIRTLAYSPDGERLVSGDESGLLVIWDPVTGNPLWQANSLQSGIWGVAWSPDGKALVTAGEDGSLRFW